MFKTNTHLARVVVGLMLWLVGGPGAAPAGGRDEPPVNAAAEEQSKAAVNQTIELKQLAWRVSREADNRHSPVLALAALELLHLADAQAPAAPPPRSTAATAAVVDLQLLNIGARAQLYAVPDESLEEFVQARLELIEGDSASRAAVAEGVQLTTNITLTATRIVKRARSAAVVRSEVDQIAASFRDAQSAGQPTEAIRVQYQQKVEEWREVRQSQATDIETVEDTMLPRAMFLVRNYLVGPPQQAQKIRRLQQAVAWYGEVKEDYEQWLLRVGDPLWELEELTPPQPPPDPLGGEPVLAYDGDPYLWPDTVVPGDPMHLYGSIKAHPKCRVTARVSISLPTGCSAQGGTEQTLSLGPGESRSFSFTIDTNSDYTGGEVEINLEVISAEFVGG